MKHPARDAVDRALATSSTRFSLPSCRELTDVDPLAELPSLAVLDLGYCTSLVNIRAIATLAELRQLTLAGCEALANLEDLRGLRALTTLDLSGCLALMDLSPLADLPALRELKFNQYPFENLRPLRSATLRTLAFYGHRLTTLDGLAGLPALESLTLRYGERLADVDALADATRMTSVDLGLARALPHGLREARVAGDAVAEFRREISRQMAARSSAARMRWEGRFEHADEAALYAAVLRAPDDDAPRLAYAAWLDAHGDPRGEYIRTQIALKNPPSSDEAHALGVREWDLWRAHHAEWTPPAWQPLESFAMRRGFLDAAVMTPANFLAHGAAIFEHAPLRSLAITPDAALLSAVVASPLLARVAALALPRVELTDALVSALAANPHLANLRALDLSHNAFGAVGTRALCASSSLRGLTSLTLTDCVQLGDDGIAALAGLSLERLVATKTSVGDAGLAALVASPTMARLRDLVLSGNPGITQVDALAASPHMTALASLWLENYEYYGGVANFTPLDTSPHLVSLRDVYTAAFYVGETSGSTEVEGLHGVIRFHRAAGTNY